MPPDYSRVVDIMRSCFLKNITPSLLPCRNQRRPRRNQPVPLHLLQAYFLQPRLDRLEGVACAACCGHGEGHQLHHEGGETGVGGLVGDLVYEGEEAAGFEGAGDFCQYCLVQFGWEQVGDMEIKGYVEAGGEVGWEVVADDVGAEEGQAVGCAGLFCHALACFDAGLDVEDGGL